MAILTRVILEFFTRGFFKGSLIGLCQGFGSSEEAIGFLGRKQREVLESELWSLYRKWEPKGPIYMKIPKESSTRGRLLCYVVAPVGSFKVAPHWKLYWDFDCCLVWLLLSSFAFCFVHAYPGKFKANPLGSFG